MTPWPILGALLSLAEAYTHSTVVHYMGSGYQIVSWTALAFTWWRLQSKRTPLAIIYGCPNRCGFQGDEAGVDAHIHYCLVAARRS